MIPDFLTVPPPATNFYAVKSASIQLSPERSGMGTGGKGEASTFSTGTTLKMTSDKV